MSGGHFDYKEFYLEDIAASLSEFETFMNDEEVIKFFEKRGFTVIIANHKISLGFVFPCPVYSGSGCIDYMNRPLPCRQYKCEEVKTKEDKNVKDKTS